MGVRTRAEERVEAARLVLDAPARKLHELLEAAPEDLWGWDEYAPEFKAELREIYVDLLRLRDRLRRAGA